MIFVWLVVGFGLGSFLCYLMVPSHRVVTPTTKRWRVVIRPEYSSISTKWAEVQVERSDKERLIVASLNATAADFDEQMRAAVAAAEDRAATLNATMDELR